MSNSRPVRGPQQELPDRAREQQDRLRRRPLWVRLHRPLERRPGSVEDLLGHRDGQLHARLLVNAARDRQRARLLVARNGDAQIEVVRVVLEHRQRVGGRRSRAGAEVALVEGHGGLVVDLVHHARRGPRHPAGLADGPPTRVQSEREDQGTGEQEHRDGIGDDPAVEELACRGPAVGHRQRGSDSAEDGHALAELVPEVGEEVPGQAGDRRGRDAQAWLAVGLRTGLVHRATRRRLCVHRQPGAQPRRDVHGVGDEESERDRVLQETKHRRHLTHGGGTDDVGVGIRVGEPGAEHLGVRGEVGEKQSSPRGRPVEAGLALRDHRGDGIRGVDLVAVPDHHAEHGPILLRGTGGGRSHARRAAVHALVVPDCVGRGRARDSTGPGPIHPNPDGRSVLERRRDDERRPWAARAVRLG